MLLARSGHRLVGLCARQNYAPTFSRLLSGQANPAQNLDPTLQSFLNNEDITLHGRKNEAKSMKYLEVVSSEGKEDMAMEIMDIQEAEQVHSSERKSPAAFYGSHQIGAVILPNQLQNAINVMISEADRPQLHQDAKRLFQEGSINKSTSEEEWNSSYDTSYRSRSQTARFAERDASAFASVALPAHYSAIVAVFDHLKRRLEKDWSVSRVIDWGAGTGSGLWAALHTFQTASEHVLANTVPEKQAVNSTITSYVGIDKRDGLVAIGKRLLRGVETGNLTTSWQRSWHEDDVIAPQDGNDVLALSAFALSSLPTDLARKQLIKEMWQSGAQTLVLIDHNTPEGFDNIAQARQLLLDLGAKEAKAEEGNLALKGCHVVAPCPHDNACPLMHGSSRLVCGFSQRMQRPAFVRKTKHSKLGHEDVGYSYVVIRRGPRPVAVEKNTGRVGEVGRRELRKEAMANAEVKELLLQSEFEETPNREVVELEEASFSHQEQPSEHLQENLRLEAFNWPRLVFPPLKKSGHVILDSCTTEGKIMRLIIPKSQGKQEYYDARKASWGDMFPHPPKNAPVERLVTQKKNGSTSVRAGADIGKRGNEDKKNKKERNTYEAISRALKDEKRKSRRDRVQSKGDW